MSDSGPRMPLEDLYQEVILDHNRRPRNFKALEAPDVEAHGVNPLCGDECHVYLRIGDGQIAEVGFQGKGCAISKSSASMMTTKIKGKSLDETRKLKDVFLAMATRDVFEGREELGSLSIFEGVKKYPIRVKCATMPWHVLDEALSKYSHGTSGSKTEKFS